MAGEVKDGATAWPASAVQPASRIDEDFDLAWNLVADTTSAPRENLDAVAATFVGICQARVAESLDRIAAVLEERNDYDED